MLNAAVEKHLKIARTLINATLDGNAVGSYTLDDTEMMIRGALADVGYALALFAGVEDDVGNQVDVGKAVTAAVAVVAAVSGKVVTA